MLEQYAKSRSGDNPWWKLYQGDSRYGLTQLEGSTVDCVVTSPPYFWQRDYGVDGQIGMEATIQEFVDNVVQVFDGVGHMLKPRGVVFLNLGDSYYNAKGRPHGRDAKHAARMLSRRQLRAVDGPGLGLPRKSMIGIPWRVALALQQKGWVLRSDIIWVRRSAMPEPTSRDRAWRRHEYVFLLSKQPLYDFDRDGLDGEEDVWEAIPEDSGAEMREGIDDENWGNVWDIAPERFSAARGQHYAPYPRGLVERCLAVGCPVGGVVLDPFAGGGTTLDVALSAGRSAIGVELSERFCSVIANRLGVERPEKFPTEERHHP